MKQFVKALNKDGDCFKYISKKFHKHRDEIFERSQIRRDEILNSYMTDIEKNACNEIFWSLQNVGMLQNGK